MPDDLFEEQVDAVVEAVEDGENAVLVSEPFGGRSDVLDTVESRFDAERVSYSSVAEPRDLPPSLPSNDVVLVDGCEYLYTRRVDGFTTLEGFIDSVASTDATVVSSWNSYAWSYARHAADVGVLGTTVELPTLDAAEIARTLADEYDVSEFRDDYDEVMSDDTAALRDRLPYGVGRIIEQTSENVFEKISAASGGNPGVARAVYEERLWQDDADGLFLTDDQAFALRVVLSKGEVHRDVLRSVVRPRSVDAVVRTLSDADVVDLDGERVALCRERLVDTVDYLRRRRLVW